MAYVDFESNLVRFDEKDEIPMTVQFPTGEVINFVIDGYVMGCIITHIVGRNDCSPTFPIEPKYQGKDGEKNIKELQKCGVWDKVQKALDKAHELLKDNECPTIF